MYEELHLLDVAMANGSCRAYHSGKSMSIVGLRVFLELYCRTKRIVGPVSLQCLQVPRTRVPQPVQKRPHRPPPPIHVLHAHANSRPPHTQRSSPQFLTHNPHLPPHQRLPQSLNRRRRLALVPSPCEHCRWCSISLRQPQPRK